MHESSTECRKGARQRSQINSNRHLYRRSSPHLKAKFGAILLLPADTLLQCFLHEWLEMFQASICLSKGKEEGADQGLEYIK